MGASDNVNAAVSGALGTVNDILGQYIKNKLDTQSRDYLARQQYGYETQQKMQLMPLEEESRIRQERAKNQDTYQRQLDLETQKDTQMGSDFSPYAQRELSLDPSKRYRITEVNNALNSKANASYRQGVLENQQNRIDVMSQGNEVRQARVNAQLGIAGAKESLFQRLMNYFGGQPIVHPVGNNPNPFPNANLPIPRSRGGQPKMMIDANGNKANVYPDGTIEEIP